MILLFEVQKFAPKVSIVAQAYIIWYNRVANGNSGQNSTAMDDAGG